MTLAEKVRIVLKKIMKNPSFIKEVYCYLKNDCYALLGRYKYRYPIIFIAGLPKSGTTWVQTELARVPGYNMRPTNDPDRCTENHDVCKTVFCSLPLNRYSVLKLHTRYTPTNYNTIIESVPRFVVMIRDLRDMCISRYFHVKNEHTHRHSLLYNQMSEEDGIMHCIGILEEEYVPWVKNWAEVIRKKEFPILFVQYERLNQNPVQVFRDIFSFFELPISKDVEKKVQSSKIRKGHDLGSELSKNQLAFSNISTKRKGIIGDWKNHLTHLHKKKFKEIAGDLLIELGYEKNHEW
ncbi:sulfotransferase domain-containing protein [uncultured Desulfobacter sp.]|uniref:sulfotransferase domain-containing protein n=1 Tax=uncultured Desulfobacter sp. TaxID=240139 RepID=UPI002AAB2739|nr:sulfotransferase domain-containing protein [uncultured Desulfobacter sp.]